MPRIEVRLSDIKKLRNLISFMESVNADVERSEVSISIVYSVSEDKVLDFVNTAIRNKIPIFVVPDDEVSRTEAVPGARGETVATPAIEQGPVTAETTSGAEKREEELGLEDIGISVEDIEREGGKRKEPGRQEPETEPEKSEEEHGSDGAGEEEEEEVDIGDISKYFQDDEEEEVSVFSRVK